MDDQQQSSAEADLVQFARKAGRDIFGDLDDHLPEVRVNGDVKIDALRVAARNGQDLTGWMRELVYAALYGPHGVAMFHQVRAERALGNSGRAPALSEEEVRARLGSLR